MCIAIWMTVGLFGRQPYKPDEAYTIGLVKSVVETGDWVVPRLVGEPFMEKPSLFFVVAAGFSKWLPWLPMHEAARFAVVLFVAVGLWAIAACARELYGAGSGRLAALLTLATVGTVARMHQLITDTGLFAGVALALLGLVKAPRQPGLAGVALGLGLAIAFLTKGLLGPGLIVCTTLALLAHPAWRGSSMIRACMIATAIAVPLAACWLVPLYLRAPDQLHVWFYDNNLGRFFGLNALGPKKDMLFYGRTLTWYAQPCLPLALWGWSRAVQGDRTAPAQPGRAAPAAFLIVSLVVLTLASDGRELYALVLVPALAVAALDGLLALPIELERRLAIGVAAVFGILAALLLCAYAAAVEWPAATARLPADIAMPGMVSASRDALALYAVITCAILVCLAPLRRPLRGALPLAGAAGIALLWATLVLPWGQYLDALKGYREVARSLEPHLPAAGCIASRGLGEGERALLDYYIGLRTVRMETHPAAANQCSAVLIQVRSGETDNPPAAGTLAWLGARPGSDNSSLRLYVYGAPAQVHDH
ncbi:MAG TPA: glycosyltransferase family 39 protein [Methylibium sp.]